MNFTDVATVRSCKSAEQSQLAHTNGRIDSQFDNFIYATDRMKACNGKLKVFVLWRAGGVIPAHVCFGIRETEPELQKMLNKVLTSMNKGRTMKTRSENVSTWISAGRFELVALLREAAQEGAILLRCGCLLRCERMCQDGARGLLFRVR